MERDPGELAVLDGGGKLLACSEELERELGIGARPALEAAVREGALGSLAEGESRLTEIAAGGRTMALEATRVGGLLVLRLGGGRPAEHRLRALTRLAEGMAHDARNPLNTLSIQLGLLEGKVAAAPVSAEQAGRHLKSMREQIRRVDAILSRFVQLVAPPEQASGRIDLGLLVGQAVEAFGHEARRRGVSLEAELAEAPVEGELSSISAAVLGLLLGGIEQGAGGGSLQVRVNRAGPEAVLRLSGQGPGCTESAAARARDGESPLPLIARIVELQRGQLEERSEHGRREIEVRLPLAGA